MQQRNLNRKQEYWNGCQKNIRENDHEAAVLTEDLEGMDKSEAPKTREKRSIKYLEVEVFCMGDSTNLSLLFIWSY